MYKKILVGFDGSHGSVEALKIAAQLARLNEGCVIALWIHASLPHFSGTAGEMKSELEAADAFYVNLLRRVKRLAHASQTAIQLERQTGNPSQVLVRYAQKHKFDLIVMGQSGHSRLWGRLLGHTTDRVSENAHCDVLIVRARAMRSAKKFGMHARTTT
jgi:nucleotide-binding universal stress UspA family protein